MSPTASSPRRRAAPAHPAHPSHSADPVAPAALAEQDIRRRLHAAGLRHTKVRHRLLEVLHQSAQPLSHAEIEAAIGMEVDRVTLYRALDSFVGAGLLLRQVGSDRVGRYAPTGIGNHAQHAHFHCDGCGQRYCMEHLHPPRRAALPAGFSVAGSALEYHGLCASCVSSDAG